MACHNWEDYLSEKIRRLSFKYYPRVAMAGTWQAVRDEKAAIPLAAMGRFPAQTHENTELFIAQPPASM